MRAGAALLAAAALSGQSAPPKAAAGSPTLVAMECGRLLQENLGWFSDTFRYAGERRELVAGCYLIRHPKGVLLWDAGVGPKLVALSGGKGLSVGTPIVARLAALGLRPADVTHLGISHHHADHSGQAADFPGAELLIGQGDWDKVKAAAADDPDRAQLAHWLGGDGKVTPVARDKDVFGDGSVVMLAMPGHTPGHSALLVRLKNAGAVLLSGDQYHFRENRADRGVPTFNHDRADTLASHDRFEAIARNLRARVVIQHDPRDMAALPAFPRALD